MQQHLLQSQTLKPNFSLAMEKGALFWFAFSLTLSLMASCQADEKALLAVTTGNNQFSTQLYDAIRKSNKENLIVSPISVSTVLAMIQAGARGNTSEEIRSTLHFPSDDQQLNSGYQTLLQELKGDDKVTLDTANKVYPAQGYTLSPNFTSTLKTFYNAEPQQLNFTNSKESSEIINQFVSNATREKIQNLILPSDLDAATRLVLVNAIYFKGAWKNQFPKRDTIKMDFYTGAESKVEVDMMRLEEDLLYGEIAELDAKVVSLPYKGNGMSMVILLPNNRTGLEEMESKLKTFPLEKISENLRSRLVQLFLPKFKIESTINLKDPLSELGLSSIFSESEADFTGIPDESNKEKLSVSKAIQKAFIEVNEEGSEAAAATGVAVSIEMLVWPPPEKIIYQADHPFSFYLLKSERGADTCLCLGRLENF